MITSTLQKDSSLSVKNLPSHCQPKRKVSLLARRFGKKPLSDKKKVMPKEAFLNPREVISSSLNLPNFCTRKTSVISTT